MSMDGFYDWSFQFSAGGFSNLRKTTYCFQRIRLDRDVNYTVTISFNGKLTSAPVEHTLHKQYDCKIGEQPVFKSAYFEHKFIGAN